MPLISEIKLELLRALIESSSHGYELHKKVGVATSTIYMHLEELENAGMVESSKIPDDPRNKTEYEITEDGKKLLQLLEE